MSFVDCRSYFQFERRSPIDDEVHERPLFKIGMCQSNTDFMGGVGTENVGQRLAVDGLVENPAKSFVNRKCMADHFVRYLAELRLRHGVEGDVRFDWHGIFRQKDGRQKDSYFLFFPSFCLPFFCLPFFGWDKNMGDKKMLLSRRLHVDLAHYFPGAHDSAAYKSFSNPVNDDLAILVQRRQLYISLDFLLSPN